MKRIALAVALFVSLAAPAWAGFDEGMAAYKRGDYETAIREWKPLAKQGVADAQYNLGVMYGEGAPQNYAQAHMWYNLAASRFSPGEDRDKVVKNRDHVAKKMTPAQISEAKELAREWKPKKE